MVKVALVAAQAVLEAEIVEPPVRAVQLKVVGVDLGIAHGVRPTQRVGARIKIKGLAERGVLLQAEHLAAIRIGHGEAPRGAVVQKAAAGAPVVGAVPNELSLLGGGQGGVVSVTIGRHARGFKAAVLDAGDRTVAQLDQPAADGRRAAIGVRAGELERAGAVLGQSAGAADDPAQALRRRVGNLQGAVAEGPVPGVVGNRPRQHQRAWTSLEHLATQNDRG